MPTNREDRNAGKTQFGTRSPQHPLSRSFARPTPLGHRHCFIRAGNIAQWGDGEITLFPCVTKEEVKNKDAGRPGPHAKPKAPLDWAGLPHTAVNEAVQKFYEGFALRTIRYTTNAGASYIAIMAHTSGEHQKIAEQEKQDLIMNEKGITVL